jgi:hypothetical protein
MQKPLLTGKEMWVSVRSVARNPSHLPGDNFGFLQHRIINLPRFLAGVNFVTCINYKGEPPDETNK